MCVCVFTPEAINNWQHDLNFVYMIGYIIPVASQFQFVALAVDIMHT